MPQPHFTAQLTFFPDIPGQQQTPVSSGHRLRLRLSSAKREVVAIVNLADVALVYPGDTVVAAITLIDAPEIAAQVYAGEDFEHYTNDRQTGQGVVTQILKSKP